MTTIHLIIVVFVLFAMSRTYLRLKDGELGIVSFAFWMVNWFLVGVIGFWPGVTQRIADIVGIERGIDTVVYSSIVVLFYLMYRLYVKIEHLEQDITKVVRDSALEDFKEKND